ncbi:VanZ family protein [Haloplasma contractile]|uniref:Permease protein n=1 Tax=Haloplasma contractile SSD-17B TaxID=1033810 RepID=U2FIB4_9MOLU|nr:VanZ family protein [Haloplasma contractile]ERJ10964.1 Permease protein [Haloplasma contractile SSD-17B]ERJ12972.1 Permease protein [Haloplasma contractile SSD-17B]
MKLIKKITYVLVLVVIATLMSIIINQYVVDELLKTFRVISYFSHVCNRVSVALFIYFIMDYSINLILKQNRYSLEFIANYLMLTYFIGLMGLLYGRQLPEDLSYSYMPGTIANYLFVGILVIVSIFSILFFMFKNPRKLGVHPIVAPILIVIMINIISLILSKQTPPNTINSFNFDTYIILWLNYLHLELVQYNLLGNILVAVPLGIYIGFRKSLLEGITVSILVIHLAEFIQAITNLGFYDVDDLILNGIGALMGVLFITLFLKLKRIHNTH